MSNPGVQGQDAPADHFPRVSLLIPTHNHVEFIARSIESALAQDYPSDRLEVIVVDDGSTDGTPEAVTPYLDRITYIRKENGGMYTTMNALLTAAHGELLAIQSGDDASPPGRISLQVEAFRDRPELGLHYGDLAVIDRNDVVIAESFWAAEKLEPQRGRVMHRLLGGNFISGGTLMVRRSLRDRFYPLPAFAVPEDWWIALRIAEVADVDYTTEALCHYRLHENNANIGATGARNRRRLRRLPGMLRWIVTEAACPEASAADWITLLCSLLDQTVSLASDRADFDRLLPVDDQRRALASTASASAKRPSAGGDRDGAIRAIVAALGHDHADPGALALVHEIALALGVESDGDAGLRVIADGAELISDHELLAAYGRTFSSGDPVLLLAVVDPGRIDEFVGAVHAAGLDAETAADIVVQPASSYPQAVEALADGVHAVLTEQQPPAALQSRLSCGAARIGVLKPVVGLWELRLLKAKLSD